MTDLSRREFLASSAALILAPVVVKAAIKESEISTDQLISVCFIFNNYPDNNVQEKNVCYWQCKRVFQDYSNIVVRAQRFEINKRSLESIDRDKYDLSPKVWGYRNKHSLTLHNVIEDKYRLFEIFNKSRCSITCAHIWFQSGILYCNNLQNVRYGHGQYGDKLSNNISFNCNTYGLAPEGISYGTVTSL